MGRDKLVARFDEFAVGMARFDFGKRQVFYRRSARALKLIQVGELSAGRHALEGAEMATQPPSGS